MPAVAWLEYWLWTQLGKVVSLAGLATFVQAPGVPKETFEPVAGERPVIAPVVTSGMWIRNALPWAAATVVLVVDVDVVVVGVVVVGVLVVVVGVVDVDEPVFVVVVVGVVVEPVVVEVGVVVLPAVVVVVGVVVVGVVVVGVVVAGVVDAVVVDDVVVDAVLVVADEAEAVELLLIPSALLTLLNPPPDPHPARTSALAPANIRPRWRL